jgi:hypothetical protein
MFFKFPTKTLYALLICPIHVTFFVHLIPSDLHTLIKLCTYVRYTLGYNTYMWQIEVAQNKIQLLFYHTQKEYDLECRLMEKRLARKIWFILV